MAGGSKRLRALTWEDYGISKGRYKELQGFCLQYHQKKREAKKLGDYALAAMGEPDGVGTGCYHRSERALRDCRMIEEAAMWAADAGGYKKAWRAIISNVVDGVGFGSLAGPYALPFSIADFYGVRRAFFHRLDVAQEGESGEGITGNYGESGG